MTRFFEIIPALAFAAGLLPIAANAGPVAGRLIAPVQQSALSQGRLSATDPLAGQRQTATGTAQTPDRSAQAAGSGLSLGHFSNSDPLSGEQQQAGNTTPG